MSLDSRLKWAREAAGLTLSNVFERTGIGLSSLSEFENGHRPPSTLQLAELAGLYRRSMDFFFQPGTPQSEVVLWREKPAENAAEIERRLIQLAEQFQRLEASVGNPELCDLSVMTCSTVSFGYADAEKLAHDFRINHSLGERPGATLLRVLEEVCRVKVFHLPFQPSGTAACTLDERYGAAILLNSNNIRWRRNFDLAHELFHLLTWKIFRTGDHSTQTSEQEEKYANVFARHLLIPSEVLRLTVASQKKGKSSLDFDDLFEIARQFDVSVQALVWQLVSIRLIEKTQADELLKKIEGKVSFWEQRQDETPPIRPLRFEALAREAVEKGTLSVGKFAEYMGISRKAAMKIVETEIYAGMEPETNAEVEIADS